jgi:glycosyltransferase involved in cell wall biosynthesis
MIVHQLLSGAGPRDAVTTEALAFRARFRAWGWEGGDHAARYVPGLVDGFASAARLRPRPDEVVIVHHSAGWPRLSDVLSLPGAKLLRYHNVTPARWLWNDAPVVAAQCAVGRQQLPPLARSATRIAAVSQFNAVELERAGTARTPDVVPLLREVSSNGLISPRRAGPPTVLFVGRLSPHKRQDDAIRAFALYRRYRQADARLVLVGDPVTERYEAQLRALADELAPGAVRFESGLSEHELAERYRSAHAFLCLSAHEGFCIPLLEAFRFGVPVVARPAGAVPEVVADAGLLVEDDDLAVVAELLHLVITDQQLRARLRERGAARAESFAPERVAQKLRAVVEATAAG